MLYYLLVPLIPKYRIFNLITYISFRAVMAAVTGLILSFILGPIILGPILVLQKPVLWVGLAAAVAIQTIRARREARVYWKKPSEIPAGSTSQDLM